MQKLIPISSIGDLTKVVNNNADYTMEFFKQQNKINKYVVFGLIGFTVWGYLKEAQSASQNNKIKELEKRIAELEPKEGEKGQE